MIFFEVMAGNLFIYLFINSLFKNIFFFFKAYFIQNEKFRYKT